MKSAAMKFLAALGIASALVISRNGRIVRAEEYQLHSPLRQLGRTNGAVLLKSAASRYAFVCHATSCKRGPASGWAPLVVKRLLLCCFTFCLHFAAAVSINVAIIPFQRKVCSQRGWL